MKEKLKSIEKMLEKELSHYASEHDSGKHMEPKDTSILGNLALGAAAIKALCLIEEIKEHGLDKMISKIGGDKEHKQMGFKTGHPYGPWGEMIDKIAPWTLPVMQYDDDMGDETGDIEARQGVRGTGPYANPRFRRRGGKYGIGRRRGRAKYEYDNDIDYDDLDETHDEIHDNIDMRRGGRRRRDSRGRFIRSDMDRTTSDTLDDIRHDIRQDVRDEVRSELDRHKTDIDRTRPNSDTRQDKRLFDGDTRNDIGPR